MSLPIAKIHDDVKDQFLKQGDNIQIFPLFGRKRSFSLNRTRYNISLEKSHKIDISGISISIPTVDLTQDRFKLSLVEAGGTSFYTLESCGDLPFKINGNLSYKSIIQKLDEIIIGHTKINFSGVSGDKRIPISPLQLSPTITRSTLYTLLEGETGSGKSYLARKLHEDSDMIGEFVHINISALNENLVESELFGHVKGAFTGASYTKDGVIKRARNGTLFIDEVDSLSKEMQVKLLLFLDGKKLRAVGSDQEESVETRIIFAAGRSLRDLVANGEIRSDFYYRISSGHRLKIPALRENEDFLNYYLQIYELNHEVTISKKLRDFYLNLKWPGNIRQLFGHLERKKLFSSKSFLCIDESDLELLNEDLDLQVEHGIISLRHVKENYIQRAYYQCDEDIGLTAKALKISYNTVKKVIDELTIKN